MEPLCAPGADFTLFSGAVVAVLSKVISMSAPLASIAARILTGAPARPLDCQLDRMLGLAQASPASVIAVAGPDAGEAMSGLWRRGYPRVEAARRATCPSADELCDLLLVAGCACARDAAHIARQTRAMLRTEGLAVIDAGRMSDPDERLRLCGLLAEAGFALQDGAHLAAEIAVRKLPDSGWRKAA